MASDPVADAIRAKLDARATDRNFMSHSQAAAACRAVLDLDPSASHREVILTLAKKLGVASEWLAESYEAMPDQLREML